MDISRSPHVEAAREAKRPTRWWIGAVLMPLLFIIFGTFGTGLVSLFGEVEKGSVVEQLSEIPAFGFTLIAVAVWVRYRDRRPFTSIGFQRRSPVSHVLTGMALGAVLLAVPTLALVIGGAYDGTEGGPGTTVGVAAIWIAVPLLLAVLVQSSTEEAMMRGYTLQLTGTQLTGWAAVLAPSVAFAVSHMDFHPIVLTNIVLVAIVFTFMVLRIGTLWMACGMHAGWNWAQGNLFGIPVSGNARDVSVFRVAPDTSSASWLTGGDFGVEGSIAATVALALAAYASYRWWMAGPSAQAVRAARAAPAAV